MDWLATLSEHWKWLSPPSLLLAFLGWLGRRKGAHPWQAIVRQLGLRRDLATCQQDLADAIRSRDYLKIALREITDVAAMVKAAHDEGYLTTSETLPSEPASSPEPSTRSSLKPTDPPTTR